MLADLDTDSCVKNGYIIEIDNYALEDNANDAYRVKLDLEKLISSGKKLSDIIIPANDYSVYKVVTSEVEIIPDNTFIMIFHIHLLLLSQIVENNCNKCLSVLFYQKIALYSPL